MVERIRKDGETSNLSVSIVGLPVLVVAGEIVLRAWNEWKAEGVAGDNLRRQGLARPVPIVNDHGQWFSSSKDGKEVAIKLDVTQSDGKKERLTVIFPKENVVPIIKNDSSAPLSVQFEPKNFARQDSRIVTYAVINNGNPTELRPVKEFTISFPTQKVLDDFIKAK